MKQFGEAIERATAYCTYCPKLCRFSCPVAEAERRETVTPWGLMRLLEFTRTGDVELDKEVAETFYHCTGCARCQTWCEHDNDVTAAMWAARARARDEGIVPDALQGFEIEFMRYSAPEQLPTMESALVQQCFDQNAAWLLPRLQHTPTAREGRQRWRAARKTARKEGALDHAP